VPGKGGVLQGTAASPSLQVCEIRGLLEDVSGDWKTEDLRVLGGEGYGWWRAQPGFFARRFLFLC
jgi:hypothetical protein